MPNYIIVFTEEIMNMFFLKLVLFVVFFRFNACSSVNPTLQIKKIRHVLGVCSNEKVRFYLTRQGRVFIEGMDEPSALRLPNHIIQIKFYNDVLYILRAEGTVWFLTKGRLRLLPVSLPIRQMEVVGGGLYLLGFAGGMLQFDKNGEKDLLPAQNLEMMVAHGDDKLYLLDSWGQFYSYDVRTAQFLQIAFAPNTIQLVSTDHAVFLLKANGEVWKYEDQEFFPLQLDFPVQKLAGGDDVYLLSKDSSIWRLADSVHQLSQLPFSLTTTDILWDRDSLFICHSDGIVSQYKRTLIHRETQGEYRKKWNNDFFPMKRGFSFAD